MFYPLSKQFIYKGLLTLWNINKHLAVIPLKLFSFYLPFHTFNHSTQLSPSHCIWDIYIVLNLYSAKLYQELTYLRQQPVDIHIVVVYVCAHISIYTHILQWDVLLIIYSESDSVCLCVYVFLFSSGSFFFQRLKPIVFSV